MLLPDGKSGRLRVGACGTAQCIAIRWCAQPGCSSRYNTAAAHACTRACVPGQVQQGCAFNPVPRGEVANVLAGMTILFTGDSQVRNMWVMLCRLLKLKYPGDGHDHDAHVQDLSDVRTHTPAPPPLLLAPLLCARTPSLRMLTSHAAGWPPNVTRVLAA